MKRSNLIPITRIYDIYPKYTYSDDVKKFMDEIVDIDRANVYTNADIAAILEDLKAEIEECVDGAEGSPEFEQTVSNVRVQVVEMIQDRINTLKGENNGIN